MLKDVFIFLFSLSFFFFFFFFFFFLFCDALTRFRIMASFYGASRLHSLDTPHSVGFLWTSDQPDTETSTWQHTALTTDRHPCPRGDSNTIPASEQPQIHALDRATTGIGYWETSHWKFLAGHVLVYVETQYPAQLQYVMTQYARM